MTKHKKIWPKLMDIIRDPAWNFTSCLVTTFFGILGIISLAGISGLIAFFFGKFQIFLSWLLSPILVLRIYIIIFAILIFLILLPIVIRILNNRNSHPEKKGTIPRNYYNFWNVLWKGSSSMWGNGAFIIGPYCPEHQLELAITFDRKEERYIFYCPGLPEQGKHTIIGPSIEELIIPRDRVLAT